MTDEAIVLAGGLGTRLKQVVSDVPKPMAAVNGRPFLDYVLSLLSANGIRRVVLAVGYKHSVIEEYLMDPSAAHRMEIAYSFEDEPLGTGGAIFKALSGIHGNAAFVLNGDTYFDVPLADLEAFARATAADVAFALTSVENSSRYGTVSVAADGHILSFDEKVPGVNRSAVISGGIYFMKKSLIDNYPRPAKFSIEQDLFHRELQHLNAFGKVYPGKFIDIGIPEDYAWAQSLLKHV